MSASHETLRDLSGLYVLDALTSPERETFEEHLAQCATCRAEVAALRATAVELAQSAPQVDPPAHLREQVISAATGIGARAAAGGAAQLRPPARILPWLAAAASIAAAVGLGVYASRLRGRESDLQARLQQALAEAAFAQTQIADVRRAALEAQSQVAVLAAPDLVRIDLIGQAAAPSARARALWSRSRGMIFTAANLPALQAGRVYQLWVIPATGSPIGVGLLQPDPTGAMIAIFQTAPDIPSPTQIAVSDEPAGGVASPTGMIWIAGKPVS